jgi:hypothetical protein
MKRLLITAALLLLAPQQLPLSTYAFRAVVVDSNGQKVAGAIVEALSLQGFDSGRMPGAKSKDDGSILIGGLTPGKYRFYVWKESAGVPDTSDLIYQRAEDHYAELQVGPESVNAAPVELHLPAPYGAATVRIRDAERDTLVPKARIRLEAVEKSQGWIETGPALDGTFVALLPERATKLQVSAPGYETWTYPGYLVLQGGTSQSVEVKLTRK